MNTLSLPLFYIPLIPISHSPPSSLLPRSWLSFSFPIHLVQPGPSLWHMDWECPMAEPLCASFVKKMPWSVEALAGTFEFDFQIPTEVGSGKLTLKVVNLYIHIHNQHNAWKVKFISNFEKTSSHILLHILCLSSSKILSCSQTVCNNL